MLANFNIDYDAIKIFNTSSFKYVSLDNVTVTKNNGNKKIKLDQPCFLFDLSTPGFFHRFIEVAGNFLALRNQVPGLLPVYMSPYKSSDSYFTEEMADMKNTFGVLVLDGNDIEVSFDKLIYSHINNEIILNKRVLGNNKSLPQIIENDSISSNLITESVNGLKKFFFRGKNDSPAKIFLESKDSEWYEYIKDYYLNKGFTSMNMGNLPLRQQVRAIAAANEIVGFMGSALTNIIFANDSSKTTIIKPSISYPFPYEDFLQKYSDSSVTLALNPEDVLTNVRRQAVSFQSDSPKSEFFEYSDDHVYLIDLGCASLWHGVIDIIGEYLEIKKFYQSQGQEPPKPMPVLMNFNTNNIPVPQDFMIYLTKRIGGFTDNPPTLSVKNSYYFNDVSFDAISDNSFLSKVYPEIRKQQDRDKFYASDAKLKKRFKYIYKFMQNNIGQDIAMIPGKKIFLDMTDEKVASIVGERIGSKDEFDYIKSFYLQAGYEPVSLDNLSFEDQIRTVKSSERVSSIAGSSSAHALYMLPQSKFTMINLNPRYTFPHGKLLESCGPNNSYILSSFRSLKAYLETDII